MEPIETTWRFANVICESSNYILLPGRSYRKSGLIKSLTVGQAVWLKGWRMVTENQPGKLEIIRQREHSELFLMTVTIIAHNKNTLTRYKNATVTVKISFHEMKTVR